MPMVALMAIFICLPKTVDGIEIWFHDCWKLGCATRSVCTGVSRAQENEFMCAIESLMETLIAKLLIKT